MRAQSFDRLSLAVLSFVGLLKRVIFVVPLAVVAGIFQLPDPKYSEMLLPALRLFGLGKHAFGIELLFRILNGMHGCCLHAFYMVVL